MMLNEITETKSIHEFTKSMHTWYNKRRIPAEIIPYFTGVTFFDFQPIFNILNPALNLHFYPAIENDRFVLYIIDATKDKLSVYLDDPENFTNYIIEAPLQRDTAFNIEEAKSRIPTKEALERIGNWTLHNPDYIDENAHDGNIFIAFDYHANDINPNGNITGYFGLYKKSGSEAWNADIILLSDDAFYNTVRPVPPFGQGGGDEFFLLSASLG